MTSNATKNPPTDRQKRARKNLNCSLGNFSKECGQPSVTTVHETRLCQKHFELLERIAEDAGISLRHRKLERAA
jgi:hypothetical protein